MEKINAMGEEYKIIVVKEQEEWSDDALGLCCSMTKTIRIVSTELFMTHMKEDTGIEYTKEEANLYMKKVLRHELVHAFIAESGLDVYCPWANDEMLVDWLSMQIPKIGKAFYKHKLI